MNHDADAQPTAETSPRIGEAGMARWKKAVFAAVAVLGMLAVVELLLALLGVTPVAVSQDPYVGFQSTSRLFVPAPRPGQPDRLGTAPNKLHIFNPQSFSRKKKNNTFRIFTLGGSTTYGRPYDDRTSFGGWLRTFLAAAAPARSWEIINAGGVSYASYRVAALMEELNHYEPDLYIVYCGHNEFLERRTYSGIIEEHPAVTSLKLLLNHSRLYSVMGSAWRRAAPSRRDTARKRYEMTGEVKELLNASAGLDLYRRDDPFRAQVLAHYRFNLGRMVELARTAGAEIVFVQPAANYKDFSPFKSEHTEGLTADRIAQWRQRVERAAALTKDGDAAGAAEALAAAVAINPRHAQTWFDLGRARLALGRTEEAAECFRRAVAEDIVPLRALPEMHGIISEEGDRNGVPVIDFVAILTEHSRVKYGQTILGEEVFLDHVHPTIEANRLLGRALLDYLIDADMVTPDAAWSDAKAEAVAETVLAALNPRDHAIANRNLAKVLRWARKTREADRLIARAAAVLPDDFHTLVLMGNKLREEGKLDEAIEYLRRAAKIDSRFGNAHNDLGVCLARKGQVDAAIAQFREALRIEPDLAAAHMNLGQRLGERGETRAAVHHLREVVRIEPENVSAHRILGARLFEVGEVKAGMACLTKALELDADNPEILWEFGAALAREGRLDEALTYLQRSVRLGPDNAETLADLAQALAGTGRHEEAVRYYRRALEHNPKMPGVWLSLGRLFVRGEAFDKAAEIWRRGLGHVPDDASLANALAWLLATCPRRELRDGKAAVDLAVRVRNETKGDRPRARVLYTLAAAYAESRDFKRAVDTARRARELARQAGDQALAEQIGNRLRAYLGGRNP